MQEKELTRNHMNKSHLNRREGKYRAWSWICEFKEGSIIEGRFRMSTPITAEEATLEAIDCACIRAVQINKLHNINDAYDQNNLEVVVTPLIRDTGIKWVKG